MSAEGLFLGLLMLCLQPDCPAIINSDTQARVLLVNATTDRCGSQCRVCGGRSITTHQPRLYIDPSDLLRVSKIDLQTCEDKLRCGEDELVYWDLSLEKLCFSGIDHMDLEEKGSRVIGTEKPSAATPEETFDWLPSIRRLDRNFELQAGLNTGLKAHVISWVDLDGGELRAALVGRDESGTDYSIWEASPDIWAVRDDFPRALAEAAIWKAPSMPGTLTIEDCTDRSRFLRLRQDARFVVANLPDPCSGTISPQKELVHFRAYFGVSKGDNCAAPRLRESSSTALPGGLKLHIWIKENKFHRYFCTSGIDNALCPPTKYP